MYIFPLLGMNCTYVNMSPHDCPTPAGWSHSETRFDCVFNNLASFLASLFPCWTVYELSQCYLHPAHSLIRGAQRHKRSLFVFLLFIPGLLCFLCGGKELGAARDTIWCSLKQINRVDR